MNKDELILVTVGGRNAEPAEMFAAHVPRQHRRSVPHVNERPEGTRQWVYGDRPIGPAPRADDGAELVRRMDAAGQAACLRFPGWPGFAGRALNQGTDSVTDLIMIKAYNDWTIDEWCAGSPGRFIPCGLLPLHDVHEAAREVGRLAAKGCHTVAFPVSPEQWGLPTFHSRLWYPLFRALAEHGTVPCLDAGSTWRHIGRPGWSANAAVADLMWAVFWKDFPRFRWTLVGGNAGWIRRWLRRSEQTVREFPDGMPAPTELFDRHIMAAGPAPDWHEVDNMVVDGTPGRPEDVLESIGHLPDAAINKITHGNALRAYRFDLFGYGPRERWTAGRLRGAPQPA